MAINRLIGGCCHVGALGEGAVTVGPQRQPGGIGCGCRVNDHDDGFGVIDEVGAFLGREGRVEWHVNSAGPQARKVESDGIR